MGRRAARAAVLLALAVLALGALAASASAGGFAVTKTPSKKVAGTATFRIGWFYTDEEYTGDHMDRLKVTWPSCVKAGGQYVDFPGGVHLYPFREPPGPKNHLRLLAYNGAFFTQLYVGASAKPGKKTLTLKCLGPKKVFLGTGKLKVSYVRKPMSFHSGDVPPTLLTPLLFAGEEGSAAYTGISLPSCAEAGIGSITVTSPALAPDSSGARTATLIREDPSSMEDGGYFKGGLKGASDTPPGEYPISIDCGSGLIGTGMITLRPAL